MLGRVAALPCTRAMLLAPRPPACPAAPSARAPQRRRRVTPACASAAPAPPPAPSPPPQQPPPPAPRPPPLVSPGRRALVVGAAACGCGALALAAPPLPALAGDARVGAFALSEAQWRAALPGGAYRVLRQGWTEAPWSSPLGGEHRPGVFACAGCGQPLFDAAAKARRGAPPTHARAHASTLARPRLRSHTHAPLPLPTPPARTCVSLLLPSSNPAPGGPASARRCRGR